MPNVKAPTDVGERLSADDRRASLLDVTRDLLVAGGADAVTMGTVAERAGVTRALLYKHFANRNELLAALHRRETNRLNRTLSMVVAAAPTGFEAKVLALVRAALEATEEHELFFTPLRTFGANAASRSDRRDWDRRTVNYFAELAEHDFGIDRRTARAAVSLQLSGIQNLRAQLRARPGATQRSFLEHVYVETAIGALRRLADP